MVTLSVAMTAFGRYAASQRPLVKDQLKADRISYAMRHSPSFLIYAVGIGVSLVLPTLGIGLYLASAIERGARSPALLGFRRARRRDLTE
jgi:hypothetical protein